MARAGTPSARAVLGVAAWPPRPRRGRPPPVHRWGRPPGIGLAAERHHRGCTGASRAELRKQPGSNPRSRRFTHIGMNQPPRVSLTRRLTFAAVHILVKPALYYARNSDVFVAC